MRGGTVCTCAFRALSEVDYLRNRRAVFATCGGGRSEGCQRSGLRGGISVDREWDGAKQISTGMANKGTALESE